MTPTNTPTPAQGDIPCKRCSSPTDCAELGCAANAFAAQEQGAVALAERDLSLMLQMADKITADITTGHDWPNTQEELGRLDAARLLRKAHACLASTPPVEAGEPRRLIEEMLELADNWPGIAYTADLERRVRAFLAAPAVPAGGQEPRIDPMQDPMRPAYFTNCADETPAEQVLRKLACWLGVGGYNAEHVDAQAFHEKIVWGIGHLLKSASPVPSPAPVELWRGNKKVTIYPGERVIRVWGANLETEMADEPHTLASAQAALDWLYESEVGVPSPAVEGWRPIESAPKDGSEFLAYRRGAIATASRVPRDDCEMWVFGGCSAAVECWPDIRPTHWMPLPPPPLQPQAPGEKP
jgi:hypothetical protein